MTGRQLTAYRIQGSPIGCGAEGEVFFATERSTERPLACKKRSLAPGGKSSPMRVKQAQSIAAEAAALSELCHPNIVELVDHIFSSIDETHYFMLQRCSTDLFNHIMMGAGPGPGLEEAETKLIMRDVVRGLSFMHECGWTHNDVKPENVLLQYTPDQMGVQAAKLTDFGFSIKSEMNGADAPSFRSSVGDGTLQYMAPEVLRAAADTSLRIPEEVRQSYDTRSADVYALGVLLFVAL